ncbi:MAG: magnesium transporter [Anaerolineales bacterium]|jgi:magnesium transporter
MTINQAEIDAILEQVREALTHEDWKQAVSLVEALRPPDQADLFGELSPDAQNLLLPRLDPEDSADILEELEDEQAAEVAERLEPEELTRILDAMEPDEAADLLGDIAPERVSEALSQIEDVEDILPLLEHPDETAGGLMTSAEVVLHKGITVEEALDYLRVLSPDSDAIYYLFVVDDEVTLVGVVSLRQLVVTPPSTRIEEIMDTDVLSVRADTDQEEAARLMSRYDLLALPVVDDQRHLLGVITHDDLVEVLEDEATEDIYRLGGVPEEQVPDAPLSSALRTRLPWLVLNLGTAMASATVLSLFESTIAQIAIITAFFPIVAGVSGSAGTQTLTVIVRGLALGELNPRDAIRALAREAVIGLSNGLAVGVLVALIAFVWKGTPLLGLVVGSATLLNLIAAGIAGVLVPMAMQTLKLDPALASPVLVTTLTDTLGYLIYLSIATAVLIGFV